MECQTEGIYASADLDGCTGLTLPPQILSGDEWLLEATESVSHEESAGLLGPPEDDACGERRRRAARTEYLWVSSELESSQLSEPPRKRRKTSGKDSNGSNAGSCDDVPESQEHRADSKFHEHESSQRKRSLPENSQEPSVSQCCGPVVTRKVVTVDACRDSNEEATLVGENLEDEINTSKRTSDDKLFRDQSESLKIKMLYNAPSIALPDPDAPLPSVEGAAVLPRVLHPNERHEGVDRRSSNAPSLDENVPVQMDMSPTSARYIRLPPLAHQTSSPLSKLFRLVHSLQRLCTEKTVPHICPPANAIDGTESSSLPHKIPTDLRGLYERLEAKFFSDELFQRSTITWILEKMSSPRKLQVSSIDVESLLNTSKAGNDQPETALNLIQDDQMYAPEGFDPVLSEAVQLWDQGRSEYINQLENQIASMGAMITNLGEETKNMSAEIALLRQRMKVVDSDGNMFFQCVMSDIDGKICMALNKHYHPGRRGDRRLREKCFKCKKIITDVRNRKYISDEEAQALGPQPRRAQQASRQDGSQQSTQPWTGTFPLDAVQQAFGSQQQAWQVNASLPAMNTAFPYNSSNAYVYQHGSNSANLAQLGNQQFQSDFGTQMSPNLACQGHSFPLEFATGTAAGVSPQPVQSSEASNLPPTHGRSFANASLGLYLSANQYGHNFAQYAEVPDRAAPRLNTEISVPAPLVNPQGLNLPIVNEPSPLVNPQRLTLPTVMVPAPLVNPQGLTLPTVHVPAPLVNPQEVTLQTVNSRAAPGASAKTSGSASVPPVLQSKSSPTAHPNKRAKSSPPKQSKRKASPAEGSRGPVSEATKQTLRHVLRGIVPDWMNKDYQASSRTPKTGLTASNPIEIIEADDVDSQTNQNSVDQDSLSTLSTRNSPATTSLTGEPSFQEHIQGGDCGASLHLPTTVPGNMQHCTTFEADGHTADDTTLMKELFGEADAQFDMMEDL